MTQRLTAALFALLLVTSLSAVSSAKDAPKTDMKQEMSKGPMKMVSCDAPCNFMVKSHSEKEIISIVKTHAKKMHKMDMTDKQVKDMMKTEAEVKP